jgi:hypothetical protein
VAIVKWSGLFYDVRDNGPIKAGDIALSSSLAYFQEQTKAAHAFQVVMNLAYQSADCFRVHRPIVVPAKTFLSQLL